MVTTTESKITEKTTKSTTTTTTTKEVQSASILENYYNWFNNLLGKEFQDYQIILISVAVILAPIIIIIAVVCVIRCKKEPEYDGYAPSSYTGTSGYGSISLAKQSKRMNRRDSGKSMTRGDYIESEEIIKTTLDRKQSRKNR